MTEPVLVTVAIATHDAGPWLMPSVESILAQTHRRLEVVVVDDGSTDGSVEAVERIDDDRLRVVRQARAGKAVALNRILDETEGDVVVIHDADDLSHPERVAAQVARLEAEPDLGACFTQFELIVGERHLAPRSQGLDRDGCRRLIEAMRQPSIDPTLAFRRSALPGERFDPDLHIGQCVDFILRLGERHPMVVLDRCLYSYRIHDRSSTRRDGERTARYQALVRRKALARRGQRVEPPSPSPRAGTSHVVVAHCVEAVLDARVEHRRGVALATAAACWRLAPLDPDYAKPMAYAVAPGRLLRRRRPDRVA